MAPSKDATRRNDGGASSPEDPSSTTRSTNYDRRREQVRKAQKKHREQKDLRLRKLEDELHRLYSLTTLADELSDLRFENDVLRDIIARHSIQVPLEYATQPPRLAEVTIFGDHRSHQDISVKLPKNDVPHPRQTQPPSTALESIQQKSRPDGSVSLAPSQTYTSFAQLGVDFVLSLERPCLFHTRPSDPELPSGHAMSMQGILLAGAPLELQDQTSWEVPTEQLDRLFELSGCLDLDGYITPVQAWNRITSRIQLTNLDLRNLERLRSAMIPHIKCYGFGALIEDGIFEDLYSELF
ncbi:hypothetical protein N7532_001104 [Penicillium argentinense]|uniref:BZIP domain-containing protein n=1 Tax=Penicillium argentinense TaxID=1131581 RepID=A0A9W9G1U5_9EURO|nr:uncharacterized protein N7532_001104 [Penicillium argentinense]KAJ5110569.1 hypothetical protein N7532_001104 [Penicillium argentinense]